MIEAILNYLERQTEHAQAFQDLQIENHSIQKHAKGCKCAQLLELSQSLIDADRAALAELKTAAAAE